MITHKKKRREWPADGSLFVARAYANLNLRKKEEDNDLQNRITANIKHMAKSQHELARILEAKRHVIMHMASMVEQIPDQNPSFGEVEGLMEQSLGVTKGVTSYLNSLADLADAIADNLTHVMKEMKEMPSEE
jgi:methyl-accepting chemotaxis protein